MDFNNLPGKIFLNNKFVDAADASFNILSHSLHFASSVFEGIRIYGGEPFFIKSHLNRLKISCDLMGLDLKYNDKQLIEICREIIKYNNLDSGYLRPIVFRGAGSMAPEIKDCPSILAIAGWKWENLYNGKERVKLQLSEWKKPHKSHFPVQAKSSGSYQIATLAKEKALKKGFDDALFLDTNNYVAECCACNIFWRKTNIVFTPNDHSSLNGITRRVIIKLMQHHNIEYQISDFPLSHILNADEVFLTGTAAEIINVSHINDQKFSEESSTKFLNTKFEVLKSSKEFDID